MPTSDFSGLARLGWLGGQPQAFCDALLARAEVRTVPGGKTIYGIGDPPGGVYGVATGFVDVVAALGPFLPRLVHIGRPGWWFGEAAMLTGTPRRVEVSARGEARVLFVPAAALSEMAAADPLVWRRLSALTVLHLDNALFFAGCHAAPTARHKLIGTLLRLAEPASPAGAPVDLPVSHGEIGEIGGLTRNSVGPILQDLAGSGLITVRYRQIILTDTARLAELLAEN